MCECYSKLVRAYPDVKEIQDVFSRHLKVLSKFPGYDKPGLFSRLADFVMEGYERLVLVHEHDVERRHRCEDTERLVAALVDEHLHQTYVERTTYQRSPRLKKRVRRALFHKL